MNLVIAIQLVLLAATGLLCVLAALSARRAASFDLTRDFDSLCVAVERLQHQSRSVKMQRVRQAALEPAAPQQPSPTQPLSHDDLRRLARARNGVHQ